MSDRATIYAVSSGRPPAAVAVIRISGPDAHLAGRGLAGSLPEPRVASVRQLHHPLSGELLDEALVLVFRAPASATGEDVVELHCHGGRAVVDAVLAALGSTDGLRAAMPGEFTRRAFERGRIDLTEAEGLADLLEAETESQRKAALALADGGLRRQIEAWQERLLDLSALAERAIDYDEDDETINPRLPAGCAALAGELSEWLERPTVEPLKDGLLVVVAGPPNSGKSSLINEMVGDERLIVTDVPGTTRDYVEIPLTISGTPVRLTDTAGLRDSDDPVERIGIARAHTLLRQADVLVWLGDLEHAPSHPNIICIRSKADLRAAQPSDRRLSVSAKTGEGVAALLAEIGAAASAMLPQDDAIALNRRQRALLADARDRLADTSKIEDVAILADELRGARVAFDALTGRAGVEHVLDALFSRFCLGK